MNKDFNQNILSEILIDLAEYLIKEGNFLYEQKSLHWFVKMALYSECGHNKPRYIQRGSNSYYDLFGVGNNLVPVPLLLEGYDGRFFGNKHCFISYLKSISDVETAQDLVYSNLTVREVLYNYDISLEDIKLIKGTKFEKIINNLKHDIDMKRNFWDIVYGANYEMLASDYIRQEKINDEPPIIEEEGRFESIKLYARDLQEAQIGDIWCLETNNQEYNATIIWYVSYKVIYVDETGLTLLRRVETLHRNSGISTDDEVELIWIDFKHPQDTRKYTE